MGATDEVEQTVALARHRKHWTTIVLEERDDGEWLDTRDEKP